MATRASGTVSENRWPASNDEETFHAPASSATCPKRSLMKRSSMRKNAAPYADKSKNVRVLLPRTATSFTIPVLSFTLARKPLTAARPTPS